MYEKISTLTLRKQQSLRVAIEALGLVNDDGSLAVEGGLGLGVEFVGCGPVIDGPEVLGGVALDHVLALNHCWEMDDINSGNT